MKLRWDTCPKPSLRLMASAQCSNACRAVDHIVRVFLIYEDRDLDLGGDLPGKLGGGEPRTASYRPELNHQVLNDEAGPVSGAQGNA